MLVKLIFKTLTHKHCSDSGPTGPHGSTKPPSRTGLELRPDQLVRTIRFKIDRPDQWAVRTIRTRLVSGPSDRDLAVHIDLAEPNRLKAPTGPEPTQPGRTAPPSLTSLTGGPHSIAGLSSSLERRQRHAAPSP